MIIIDMYACCAIKRGKLMFLLCFLGDLISRFLNEY